MDAPAAGRWSHFEHDADMGVRGEGATVEEAFEQAALALTAVVTEPERVSPRERVVLTAESPDIEVLFVAFLNALVYEMSTRSMLFSRFRVRIDSGRLDAEAWGEPVDVPRHTPATEVKGATFTALRVARGDDGRWTAQCIVDV